MGASTRPGACSSSEIGPASPRRGTRRTADPWRRSPTTRRSTCETTCFWSSRRSDDERARMESLDGARMIDTPKLALATLVALAALAGDLDGKSSVPIGAPEDTDVSPHARLKEIENRFREDWGGVTASELGPVSVSEEENCSPLIVQAANGVQERRESVEDHGTLWAGLTRDFDLSEVRKNAAELEAELAHYDDALLPLKSLDVADPSIAKCNSRTARRCTLRRMPRASRSRLESRASETTVLRARALRAGSAPGLLIQEDSGGPDRGGGARCRS